MNTIKFYLKELLKYFIFLSVYLLIITTINYFTSISQNTISIINYIVIIISLFMLGFTSVKKSQKKALIHGLLLSTFICMIFLLLSIIFKEEMYLYKMIFYLILYVSCITGAIIRKNIKF